MALLEFILSLVGHTEFWLPCGWGCSWSLGGEGAADIMGVWGRPHEQVEKLHASISPCLWISSALRVNSTLPCGHVEETSLHLDSHGLLPAILGHLWGVWGLVPGCLLLPQGLYEPLLVCSW